MSLTVGTAPFGAQRHGRFDFDAPAEVVYVEPFPRRVRAVIAGRTVIDSDDVLLVHRTGSLPHYAGPAGHVRVDWTAVDAWYEEDERVEVDIEVRGSRGVLGPNPSDAGRTDIGPGLPDDPEVPEADALEQSRVVTYDDEDRPDEPDW